VRTAASRHYESGQYDLAIHCLQTALCREPNLPDIHNNLGIVLATLGRLAEAAASFKNAVRLKPDFAEAHNNLGNALRAQGNLEAAVHHLRQAVRIRPDYVDARSNLELALQARGKPNISSA
jgi:tetratricopeptide (TPR) repeat protein